MNCVYQTKSVKLAHDLKKCGFDFTLKNRIYEFIYTQEFGKIKDEILSESGGKYTS